MSKSTNDYWFYTINCKDEDISDFYIGSTVNLEERERVHKSDCNKKNRKLYQYINEYGGWDNWYMYEICFQKNLSKTEAFIMETILMKELGSTLNERVAYKSEEEHKKYYSDYDKKYRQREHSRISERLRNRVYYGKKKDEINEKRREKVKCECGMMVSNGSMKKHLSRSEHNKRLNEQK